MRSARAHATLERASSIARQQMDAKREERIREGKSLCYYYPLWLSAARASCDTTQRTCAVRIIETPREFTR